MRVAGLAALVLLVAYCALGFATSRLCWWMETAPPASGAPTPAAGVVLSGVTSVHTERSHDARGTLGDVGRAARAAELDFVVLGDHPPRDGGAPHPPPRFIEDVLVVPGHELVLEGGGRLLAFGLDGIPPHRLSPAELDEHLGSAAATTVVVHGRSPRRRERWGDAPVAAYHGWEVLDVSEAARHQLQGPWAAYHLLSFLALWPVGLGHESLLRLQRPGFGTATVAAYDSLTACCARLTALAGLNHHPKWTLGGLPVLPYGLFFRTFVNHLVLDGPLPREPGRATAAVAAALRSGRVFISLGDASHAHGFRLTLSAPGAAAVEMGGEASLRPGTVLRTTPLPDEAGPVLFRVLRDGQPLGHFRGRWLALPIAQPGVYRVEVYRYSARLGRLLLNVQPWIFSNPVWVHDASAAPRLTRTGGGSTGAAP